MTEAERLMQRGFERGRIEGRVEGQRSTLRSQLRLKFRAVPDAVGPRIESASADELDRWFERVLTAPTLDAVFAD